MGNKKKSMNYLTGVDTIVRKTYTIHFSTGRVHFILLFFVLLTVQSSPEYPEMSLYDRLAVTI